MVEAGPLGEVGLLLSPHTRFWETYVSQFGNVLLQ